MKTISLDGFHPRSYQLPILDAILNKGYKRVLAILPRRAGKDITALNLCIRECLTTVMTIYYIFPTYSQGRKVIWDSVTNDGKRFLDYIPKELIESINSQEMKIRFINGSLLQIVGSDNVDNLVGTNPKGIVFSEYALQDPRAYQFLRPILVANNGWALFISTPRGANHLKHLWDIAIQNKEWFAYKLTVEETKHIPLSEIQKERDEGLISEDLIQQEYYCSFDMGIEGSYYSKYIDKMKLNNQIGTVPWESSFKVNTSWDLGVRDSTTILFWQVIGSAIRIIDSYENSKQGLEHYIKFLESKPYKWGTHIAPHDIKVTEFGSGITRWEKARQLGITFIIAPDVSIEDGIESVRSTLGRIYIDDKKCDKFLKAIENYRQEWDHKKMVYKGFPLHDWSSHFCFVGDTKILTDKGNINIRDIKIGDLVATPLGLRKVLNTHKRLSEDLYKVKTNHSEFISTANHNIFTQSGLIKSDMLSYKDKLEPYSKLGTWFWKKIYGLYSEELNLSGFKRTILSLKMSNKSSLMASFIDGMGIIIEKRKQLLTKPVHCIGRSGYITMERFLQKCKSIIKTMTPKIILSRILRCWTEKPTGTTMQLCPDLGLNLKNVNNCSDLIMTKQKSGTGAQKGLLGIEKTQKPHCPFCEELNTPKTVPYVTKNSTESTSGKNSVLINVKLGTELFINSILKSAIVRFAKLYLTVINMLSGKHVVQSVQKLKCEIPEEVFDLTIETDNCYYANGYLVSNSDNLRYLAISQSKTKDGMTKSDVDDLYAASLYGANSNLPPMFR